MEKTNDKKEIEQIKKQIWAAKKRPISLWDCVSAALFTAGLALGIVGAYQYLEAKKIENMFEQGTDTSYLDFQEKLKEIETEKAKFAKEKQDFTNGIIEERRKYGQSAVEFQKTIKSHEENEKRLEGIIADQDKQLNELKKSKGAPPAELAEVRKERDDYKKQAEDWKKKSTERGEALIKSTNSNQVLNKLVESSKHELNTYKYAIERKIKKLESEKQALEKKVKEGKPFRDGDIEGTYKNGVPVINFPRVGEKIDSRENSRYDLGFEKTMFSEAYVLYVTDPDDSSKGSYVIFEKKIGGHYPIPRHASKERILEIKEVLEREKL